MAADGLCSSGTGDVVPRRWEIRRASLKQVASKGANRYLGKDIRVGLISRVGR